MTTLASGQQAAAVASSEHKGDSHFEDNTDEHFFDDASRLELGEIGAGRDDCKPTMLVIKKLIDQDLLQAEDEWQQEGRKLLNDLVGVGATSWMHLPAEFHSEQTGGGFQKDGKTWYRETTMVCFRNQTDLNTWLNNEERAAWISKAPSRRIGQERKDVGLDYLDQFTGGVVTQPEPAGAPQPLWVTSLAVALPLFPLVLLGPYVLMFLAKVFPPFAALPAPFKFLFNLMWMVPLNTRLGVPNGIRFLNYCGINEDSGTLKLRAASASVFTIIVTGIFAAILQAAFGENATFHDM